MQEVLAPVSVGDLLDRLSILEIKANRLPDQAAQLAIDDHRRWEDLIGQIHVDAAQIETHSAEFARINRSLWDAENQIREAMANGDEILVAAVAREIVLLNDERSRIKASVNAVTDSGMRDPKHYS